MIIKIFKKIKISSIFSTLLLIFSIFFAGRTLATIKIEAFGITTMPFVFPIENQYKITACYLDEYTNQQQELDTAFKNYHSPEPPELITENYQQLQKISDSLLCGARAKILSISKLPAVVFNNQYVIYGEQDLGKAIEEHQDYAKNKTN